MADLQDQEIFDAFKGAFKPLECHADYADWRNSVKFTVRGPDGAEIYSRSMPLRDLRERRNLDTVIEAARDTVKAKGHELGPRRP